MRFSAKSVATITVCIVAFFLIAFFFIPKFYLIKEPFFKMPINIKHGAIYAGDLPIRNDDYGEGDFHAKRRGGRKHLGLDLEREIGSPVYASKSGIAKFSSIPKGYGNLVVVNHLGGWQTRYGHLEKSTVNGTRWVNQGEKIGTVGKTGNADIDEMKPHLHFEIRYKGEPVDPTEELKRRAE